MPVDFDRTFDAVYPGLFRYCHRLTADRDAAEDVAQEAFVRLYRKEVEGSDSGIRAWLYRTATHLVRDRFRVEENRRRLLRENPLPRADIEPPDRQIEREEAGRVARAALDRLPPRDREMLLMRHEGFSYREIAEVVGVATGSVGTLLARAERKFVDALHAPGGPHEAP